MATSGPLYSPGDVLVVPFPYSDRLARKRRPALVVSNAEIHASGMIWVVMITSAQNAAQPHDVAIADPASAGLHAASVARPSKIARLEPSRILREAGQMSDAEAAAVRSRAVGFLRGA